MHYSQVALFAALHMNRGDKSIIARCIAPRSCAHLQTALWLAMDTYYTPIASALNMAVLALAVVFFLKLLRHIAALEQSVTPDTDETFLGRLALMQGTSEYQLFHTAAETWNLSGGRIEEDFNIFVTQGHMPHYVRDFVRHERQKASDRRDCGPDCPHMGTSNGA